MRHSALDLLFDRLAFASAFAFLRHSPIKQDSQQAGVGRKKKKEGEKENCQSHDVFSGDSASMKG